MTAHWSQERCRHALVGHELPVPPIKRFEYLLIHSLRRLPLARGLLPSIVTFLFTNSLPRYLLSSTIASTPEPMVQLANNIFNVVSRDQVNYLNYRSVPEPTPLRLPGFNDAAT